MSQSTNVILSFTFVSSLDGSRSGYARKLPVTWGWTMILTEYFVFLHHLQLVASLDFAVIVGLKGSI